MGEHADALTDTGTDDTARALGRTASLTERRAAAARMLRASPTRSDRQIGRAVGLSADTVSAVRRTLGEPRAGRVRIGGDGRARPVSAEQGRRAAARLLAEQPDTSVRAIAREAGISLGTAHDVRRRVLAGLSPVPGDRGAAHDPAAALEALRRDPALRYSEGGRQVLRRLQTQLLAAGELAELCQELPAHCGVHVEAVIRYIGTTWADAGRSVRSRSTDEIDG
ncbi:DNA-binding CsgD family transcriptional regulator/AcrR family transcriptional regulator [Catenulispora sp. MAP12-49]|uniref:hypothetical protein n=1 Tax=Catenulispora sp. MAP12-49 TaxID=3156302 RepID=UPI003516E7FF